MIPGPARARARAEISRARALFARGTRGSRRYNARRTRAGRTRPTKPSRGYFELAGIHGESQAKAANSVSQRGVQGARGRRARARPSKSSVERVFDEQEPRRAISGGPRWRSAPAPNAKIFFDSASRAATPERIKKEQPHNQPSPTAARALTPRDSRSGVPQRRLRRIEVTPLRPRAGVARGAHLPARPAARARVGPPYPSRSSGSTVAADELRAAAQRPTSSPTAPPPPHRSPPTRTRRRRARPRASRLKRARPRPSKRPEPGALGGGGRGGPTTSKCTTRLMAGGRSPRAPPLVSRKRACPHRRRPALRWRRRRRPTRSSRTADPNMGALAKRLGMEMSKKKRARSAAARSRPSLPPMMASLPRPENGQAPLALTPPPPGLLSGQSSSKKLRINASGRVATLLEKKQCGWLVVELDENQAVDGATLRKQLKHQK